MHTARSVVSSQSNARPPASYMHCATCTQACSFKWETGAAETGPAMRAFLESLEGSAVFCQRAVQHIENKKSDLPVFCRPLLPWKQVQRLTISSFFSLSLHYPYHTPHRCHQTQPLHSTRRCCCLCCCLPFCFLPPRPGA